MELNKIFKEASIIVIPSIWEEPFGLIAAEAMANGVLLFHQIYYLKRNYR